MSGLWKFVVGANDCEENTAEVKTLSIVPLNESNYRTWKIQCRMALTKDGLLGIVSGTEAAPGEAYADKYRKFVARRNRALAIIVLSVDPSLLYLLGEPEDPGTVWKKLADQFQKKTSSNKLALRRRLNNQSRLKEGESVQKHVKAMTELFNELSVIGAPMEEEDKVVTLLASLPDSFNMLVTALEANAAVPSMEVVTERLIHEDRKANERETASSEKLFLGKKSKKKGLQCHGGGKFGHIRRYCKELDKNKHTKESKPEKHKANSLQDNMESDSESLELVTQTLTADVGDNNGETSIVDFGATCHMCNNQELMYDFVKLEKLVEVQLGDGKVLKATGRGAVTLFTVPHGGKHKKCKLQNVLLAPNLSYNLLSVSKATEAGYSVSFEDSACKTTRADGVIIAIGRKVGCLHYLDFQRETESSNSAKADSDLSKEMLWHQRYGHLGAQKLKQTSQ